MSGILILPRRGGKYTFCVCSSFINKAAEEDGAPVCQELRFQGRAVGEAEAAHAEPFFLPSRLRQVELRRQAGFPFPGLPPAVGDEAPLPGPDQEGKGLQGAEVPENRPGIQHHAVIAQGDALFAQDGFHAR